MGDKYQGSGYYKPEPKTQKTSLKDVFVVVGLVLLVLFVINMFKPNDNVKETPSTVSTSAIKNEETKPVANVITLIAGEQGEYGKMISRNKNTEFEDNRMAYFVPYGTYKITNIGEYMTQVNVYSDETVINEDGWEEIADSVCNDVLQVGESLTAVVPENYHIEIAKPTQITLEKISDSTVNEVEQTTVAPAETTELTIITEPAPKFKYDVKYISHKVDYDRNGNPVLLVTYEFTNNSDKNASWIVKLHNKVFQTGIECGGIAFHDDITSQMQMNEIQPGTTVTIVEGYPLYDDTSTVTLECGEFLGDEPMFVMDLELVE